MALPELCCHRAGMKKAVHSLETCLMDFKIFVIERGDVGPNSLFYNSLSQVWRKSQRLKTIMGRGNHSHTGDTTSGWLQVLEFTFSQRPQYSG